MASLESVAAFTSVEPAVESEKDTERAPCSHGLKTSLLLWRMAPRAVDNVQRKS